MKVTLWSLITLAALCWLGTGCGLLTDESREVEVQQQNLSAKLHKGEFEAVPGYFAPDATYIPSPGAKPITKDAVAAFVKTIQTIPSRGNVITTIKKITEIKPGVMIAAVTYNISISDPTRQSTIEWNAAVTWKKVKDKWLISEMKEISARERTSGY